MSQMLWIEANGWLAFGPAPGRGARPRAPRRRSKPVDVLDFLVARRAELRKNRIAGTRSLPFQRVAYVKPHAYRLLRHGMHGLVVLVVRAIIIIVIVVIFSSRRTNCILTSKFFLNPPSRSEEWSLDTIYNVAAKVPGTVGNRARLLTSLSRLTGLTILTGFIRVLLLLLLLLLRVAR